MSVSIMISLITAYGVAQVNHQNSMSRTALFHCMVRGDADGAYKLLRAGANPTLKGSVWETRKRKRWVHVNLLR